METMCDKTLSIKKH